MAHGPGCSDVREIFPDQGLNPGPPTPARTGGFLSTPPPVHRTISAALVWKGARGRQKREARLCGPGKAACLFSKEAAEVRPSAPAAAPKGAPSGDSGCRETGDGPQIAEVPLKGMIPVSPDSCSVATVL